MEPADKTSALICFRCGRTIDPTIGFCHECNILTPSNNKRLSSHREFAFLDIETPNRRNDRICSIGVIRADSQGRVLDQMYSLVDPDTDFDAVNVGIHGITEFDVHGSPSFPRIWRSVWPLLNGATVVAHNARFDLTVLDKALNAHGIEHGPVEYVCTMTMAGEQLRDISSCRLDVVCRTCGVPLASHHNAMDDAIACMGVFFALNMPAETSEYVPISMRSSLSPVFNTPRSGRSKSHNELIKHAMDVLEDGHVSLEEAIGLRWWLEKEDNLAEEAVVSRLLELLSSVLEDNAIDEDEESRLMSLLRQIVNPVDDSPMESIEGKVFCLTGDFEFGSKEDVASHLESLGGISSESVTRKCDYVIMGARRSAAYAHGSYGSKVRKAMEWQSKGLAMQVVTEQNCPFL